MFSLNSLEENAGLSSQRNPINRYPEQKFAIIIIYCLFQVFAVFLEYRASNEKNQSTFLSILFQINQEQIILTLHSEKMLMLY